MGVISENIAGWPFLPVAVNTVKSTWLYGMRASVTCMSLKLFCKIHPDNRAPKLQLHLKLISAAKTKKNPKSHKNVQIWPQCSLPPQQVPALCILASIFCSFLPNLFAHTILVVRWRNHALLPFCHADLCKPMFCVAIMRAFCKIWSLLAAKDLL